MLISLIIIIILFLISLGFNIFFLINKSKKIPFEEIFSILNNVIDCYRHKFDLGLMILAKKYAMLTNTGRVQPPDNSIKAYAKSKQELKIVIVKKIIRNLSDNVRISLLHYYTENGLVDYIIHELDKQDQDDDPQEFK